ncbi:FHA domain-containing protein [Elongatibacter sediminis]|uniref:FHA domain-containing protein n=1 Tax=Elongatibacter sediminis TaxID=3119006 RepID=A0AAW9R4J1_9GAMM
MTRVLSLGSHDSCDLQVEGDTVSPVHAHAELTGDGQLAVMDAGSEHGTWLRRNDQWIRVLKVHLGRQDRIRLGDAEIDVGQLAERFGTHVPVQLRDLDQLRLPRRLRERLDDLQARASIKRPRRNPETGNIEESR